MVKWKLFSKSKEEKPKEQKRPVEKTQEITEDKPLAEHHETLYSDTKKKAKKKDDVSGEIFWRNTDYIEKKVDNIHIEQAKKPKSNVDKTVDKLIKKTKGKKAGSSSKATNVIYVVSKPQPGQVKGDWAVRSHGKIFSHHRTKQAAIKNARKIAAERNATVMLQRTDGTFSEGFKPKSKK